jgi:hypothetical protein
MSKEGDLPPLSAYSFDGILGSIREVIEEDLNGIAEILGQSRLVLADQHESHLPPTGEIRAGHLPALAEASSSNEQLAVDDVLILHENASLVEGSQTGSAAYGLLERLQAAPRIRRIHSEVATSPTQSRMPIVEHRISSPAVLTEESMLADGAHEALASQATTRPRSVNQLLRLTSSSAAASFEVPTADVTSSEVWLSTGANGLVVSDPPLVSEAGRSYPLYSYDESQLFETPALVRSQNPTFASRLQRLLFLKDLQESLGWAVPPRRGAVGEGAEQQLRCILSKQSSSASTATARPASDGTQVGQSMNP